MAENKSPSISKKAGQTNRSMYSISYKHPTSDSLVAQVGREQFQGSSSYRGRRYVVHSIGSFLNSKIRGLLMIGRFIGYKIQHRSWIHQDPVPTLEHIKMKKKSHICHAGNVTKFVHRVLCQLISTILGRWELKREGQRSAGLEIKLLSDSVIFKCTK